MTGTERDPQCRSQQIAMLEDADCGSQFATGSHLAGGSVNHPLSSATQQHTPSLLENVAMINIWITQLCAGATKRQQTGCALPMVASRRRQ
ncbi:hypothetical protein ACVXHA_01225 [Escherichia coli]